MFDNIKDPELPDILGDARLERCHFKRCSYGFGAWIPQRRRISNISLVKCKATSNTWLGPAIVEDVDIVELAATGACFVQGAAFRHVRFRGRCGGLTITPPIHDEAAVRHANAEFYRGVDWAMDISEAQFTGLSLAGVPADLVRRNPRTQVIVRRPNVERLQDRWRGAGLGIVSMTLHSMLYWGCEDQVLVASEAHKRDFADELAALRRLQEMGVADPD